MLAYLAPDDPVPQPSHLVHVHFIHHLPHLSPLVDVVPVVVFHLEFSAPELGLAQESEGVLCLFQGVEPDVEFAPVDEFVGLGFVERDIECLGGEERVEVVHQGSSFLVEDEIEQNQGPLLVCVVHLDLLALHIDAEQSQERVHQLVFGCPVFQFDESVRLVQ